MARSQPKSSRSSTVTKIDTSLKGSLTASRRIAMLGDSITEGHGTSNPIYSWPHMVQKLLQVIYAILGMDPFAFQFVSAHYAFAFPSTLTYSAQESGTNSVSTTWGSARRGDTQSPGSKRWWTARFSSVDVIVRRRAATDSYVIRVDGVEVSRVTSGAPGMYRHNTGPQPFSSASAARRVEVEFLTGTPEFVGFGLYRGSETKGIQVWEMGKSNTGTLQYSTTHAAASSAGIVGGWLELLKSVNPHIVMIGWLTNDASAFKLSPADYEKYLREIVAQIRAILPNAIIVIQTPQEKYVVQVPLAAPWEEYMEAQSRVARDNADILHDPMSDYVAKSVKPDADPYMDDGVHPSDLGYERYAQNTVKTLSGARDLIEDGGGETPPVPGDDTVGPTIEWISPAAGAVLTGLTPWRARVTDPSGVRNQAVYTGPGTLLGVPRLIEDGIYGFDLDVSKLESFSGSRWMARDGIGAEGNVATTPTRAMTWTKSTVPGGGTPTPTPDPGTPVKQSYPLDQQFMMQSDWVGAFVRVEQAPLTPAEADPAFDPAAANHTSSLNLMLDKLKNTRAGEGYVPAGVYNVTSLDFDYTDQPIQPENGAPYGYDGAVLRGAGKRQTVLRQIPGSTGNMLRAAGRIGTEAGPGNNNKVSGLQIAAMKMEGTSTGGHALDLESLVGCSVRDMHISGAGKSGIYLERSVFESGVDDSYFFQNSFSDLTLVRNGRCGMESDGLAAVSLTGTNIESTGNAMDGFRLVGSSVTLINAISVGNGALNPLYRGYRFLRNGNLNSSVGNVTLIGGRSEQNSGPGGYEMEIDSGTGYLLANFFTLATAGAHGIGAGLRGYGDAGALSGLRVIGGSVRGNKTAGQKAFDIGADSRFARIDTRFEFDSFPGSPTTIAPIVTDNGLATSWDLSRHARGRVNGDTELTVAGAGLVLRAPDGSFHRVTVPNGGGSVSVVPA
jgi:lysophospholipase L1-like esterase